MYMYDEEFDGDTELHVAVRKAILTDHWKPVLELVENGADIYAENGWGERPSSHAFDYEVKDEHLIPLIIPRDTSDWRFKENILHELFQYRRWELVPLAVELGADLEGAGEDSSPLLSAIYRGNHDTIVPEYVVDILITPQTINQKHLSAFSSTPLHAAMQHGQWHLVNLLVNSGADKDSTDYGNDTPLSTAFTQMHGYSDAKFGDIIRSLMTPINVNKRDDSGRSPVDLVIAWCSKYWKLLPALIYHGADFSKVADYDTLYLRNPRQLPPPPASPPSLRQLAAPVVRRHLDPGRATPEARAALQAELPRRLLDYVTLCHDVAEQIINAFCTHLIE